MIIFNFKNYKQGEEVNRLAYLVKKYLPKSIIAVPAFDLMEVVKNSDLEVFAQHLDFFEGERATGFLTAEAAKKAGAHGSLINHSEHPLFLTHIQKTIEICKKNKLKELVCVSELTHLYAIMHMQPWAIAFEDPALISTGKSITEYNPETVRKFVAIMKDHAQGSLALCGAGITNAQDVKEAKKLGCDGVLIASALAASKAPEKLLRSLAKLK